ncbi:hypothetical protein PHMEG_00029242 [Phytophthora megakarya]|uniref:Uncharacterized protein n=1 Tax=Phytophthora megakarya TaxID=4795 RepID=A0A225V4R2_9STRA|nr:hypothetical protein PHMEG_00029242 [Phytophthora megakarya]
MPKTPECGFTDPTGGPVQSLPDQVEWYGGKMNHDGPCEIHCDDEIVLPFTVNCAVTYPDGKFPYEKAKCVGKKRLTMYWMSTILEWQVYIDCAKIGEGGSPASAATSTGGNSGGAPATNTPTTQNGSIGGEAPTTQNGSIGGEAPTTQNGSIGGEAPTTQNGSIGGEAPTTQNGSIGGEASSATKPQCKRKLRPAEK